MTSSTTSTTTPLQHNFEGRVDDVKASKSDINALILDYLTTEGYSFTATNFTKEANLQSHQDGGSVLARQQIQHSICRGCIQDAIDGINELEPQVLDNNPSLHFALLRLQLVELIRTCNSTPGSDITPALSFATTQLAPRAPTNPAFLEDLERTMALLVFSPDNLEPQLAALLHPDLRRGVADRVNKAILVCESHRREAYLRNLVRLRAWAESSAKEMKHGDLMSDVELGLDDEDLALQQENGLEAMIT